MKKLPNIPPRKLQKQLLNHYTKAQLVERVMDCNSDLASCRTDLTQTKQALSTMTADDQKKLEKINELSSALNQAQAEITSLQEQLKHCKENQPTAGRPWAYIPGDGE